MYMCVYIYIWHYVIVPNVTILKVVKIPNIKQKSRTDVIIPKLTHLKLAPNGKGAKLGEWERD
jgi:hypothetical protein